MMETQWMVATHGNPLGAVRRVVETVWEQTGLDGMLVLTNGSPEARIKPRLIDNPDRLSEINPFKPLMTLNAAALIPDLVQENPQTRFGALLRPCEMRALIEMVKHDSFTIEKVLTISVDCLGTLPADEYHWRAERKGSSDKLTHEALQFARQGGIVAYRYRSACQMCTSPEAKGGDINIHVLGLPVRQHILVEARDEDTAQRISLDAIQARTADPALVNQHKRVLVRLSERHRRTMERLMTYLVDVLPADVNAVAKQLENCGPCQTCINVCPICSINRPRRGEDGEYVLGDVMRWLISCAGCGMCEQSCPNHLPLSTIFTHIREQLSAEWGYLPGHSLDEPLPLM